MGQGILFIHHAWAVFDRAAQTPTTWPFFFFLPILMVIFLAHRGIFGGRLQPYTRHAILTASVLTLLAVFRIAVCYLSTNFISNTYATLFSEVSWLLCLGQPIYSSLDTPEHYSIPYGPYGYVLVGLCQHLLGPSIFSSKLAPFLATIGSSLLLYLALRTQVAWLTALALLALANALELPLEPIELWPRPEPFLLLAVSGGLWAATRCELWGPILLGFFLGFATDIKVYAFAFFFTAIVLAWRNHKSPVVWAAAGVTAVVTLFAPFASSSISLGNYVAMLRMMDAGRKFSEPLAVQNFEWAIVLSLIALAPLLIQKRNSVEMEAAFWKNGDLLGSLFLSFLVVSHPAGLEGSGPHQLLPFIPVFVYLAAHLHASTPSAAAGSWSWPGLSVTLSIVAFVELYAILQGIRQPNALEETEPMAKARIEDIGRIFQAKMPCVLLNATGSDATRLNDSYRAILVFNGMPIGIDATPTADYESLNYPEPDLADFVQRIRAKYNEPMVWICPKGTVPFSETSYFGSCPRIFSDHFVSTFYQYFQPAGSTACFDLYESR